MTRRSLFWLIFGTAVAGLVAWLPPGLGDWHSQVLREWPDPGHPRIVTALAVAANGARVASADAGGGVRVWSTEGEVLGVFESDSPVTALAWDSAGEDALLLQRADGERLKWTLGEPEPVPVERAGWQMPVAGSTPSSANQEWGSYRLSARSPDGAAEAFTGDDGTVHLALAGESSPRLLGAPVLGLAVSDDGRHLAVAEGAGILGSGRVAIYDRRSGRLRRALFLPDGPARCLRFAGDTLQISRGRDAGGEARNSGWRWSRSGDVPRPLADPLPCPGGEGERFTVRSLGQVHGPEAALEDRRHALLVELLPEISRAQEVRRRSLMDRLLGRFAWCGLRQDGAVVSARSRPAQPLPAILLGSLLVALVVTLSAAKLSHR